MANSDMGWFRKFLMLILCGIGAICAQENRADTSSYVDEQGRTVLIIRQIKDADASDYEEDPLVPDKNFPEQFTTESVSKKKEHHRESAMMDANAVDVDSVPVYQYFIQKYKQEGNSKRKAGIIILIFGGGVGGVIAAIGFDIASRGDGSGIEYGGIKKNTGKGLGFAGCVIGATAISISIPFFVIGKSKSNKAKRYQEKLNLYKMTHLDSQLTLRAAPFVDPLHKAGGFQIALDF